MSTTGRGFAGLPRMRGRDPEQRDRAASSLELFFDLAFVIAVSAAADGLFGFFRADRPFEGAASYLLVFFGIWWAWMNFTWFASAFDTDDWLYRVLTIVQIAGVLVLAAGVAPAMQHLDLRVAVCGYVLMRLAMVAQYLRAAHDPEHRRPERIYAAGVTGMQVLWVLNLLVPRGWSVLSFLVLVAGELAVPLVAERSGATPFHRRHIADRYGAFTLIVLGEGLLTVSTAVIEALHEAEHLAALVVLAASTLVLVAGMWWLYFAREQHQRLTAFRPVFVFGYAHYAVFAAAGALAAGIEAGVERERDHGLLLPPAVQALTTVPVAVFVLAVWAIVLRGSVARAASAALVVLGVLTGLAALVPFGVPVAAVLVAAAVVVVERDGRITRARAA